MNQIELKASNVILIVKEGGVEKEWKLVNVTAKNYSNDQMELVMRFEPAMRDPPPAKLSEELRCCRYCGATTTTMPCHNCGRPRSI